MKRAVTFLSLSLLALFSLVGTLWGQSLSVKIESSGSVHYLADSKGMTLYYFTKDVNGQSACNGGCAKIWPAFHATSLRLPSTLNASNFGTITRTDGTLQTTYMGWPLYYFAGDKASGQLKGEGVRKIWYIMTVPFYTVMEGTSSTLGSYLTDANGMTLYYFTNDSPDSSACYGNCVRLWPVFYTPNLIVPSGLQASLFGTMTRSDGTKQTTYEGHPLYYWIRDTKRGETTGQDFAKVWFVANPSRLSAGT